MQLNSQDTINLHLEIPTHIAAAEIITTAKIIAAPIVLMIRIMHGICQHHAADKPTTDAQCGGATGSHALPGRCVTHHAAVAAAHHAAVTATSHHTPVTAPVTATAHQAAEHATTTSSMPRLMAILPAITLLWVAAATVAMLL